MTGWARRSGLAPPHADVARAAVRAMMIGLRTVMRRSSRLVPERRLTAEVRRSAAGQVAPPHLWPVEKGQMVKLLLVEDDPKIAAAVQRGLEAEDFLVEVVHDG